MNHKITAVMFSMLVFSTISASETPKNTNNTVILSAENTESNLTLSDKIENHINEKIQIVQIKQEIEKYLSHHPFLASNENVYRENIKTLIQLEQFYHSIRFAYIHTQNYSFSPEETERTIATHLFQLFNNCIMQNNNIDCNAVYNTTVTEIYYPIRKLIRDENNKNK